MKKEPIVFFLLSSLLLKAQPELPRVAWDIHVDARVFENRIDTTLTSLEKLDSNLFILTEFNQFGDTVLALQVKQVQRIDTHFIPNPDLTGHTVELDTYIFNIPCGIYTEFNPSSEVKSINGNYANSMKQGLWTVRYTNGKYLDFTYVDDWPIGEFISHYPNGQIEWLGQYGKVEIKILDYNDVLDLIPTTGKIATRVGIWKHYNVFNEIDETITYTRN